MATGSTLVKSVKLRREKINDQIETQCIRCGKTRVFFRRWKEKVDGRGAVVTHVETVCPDSECQKIVDAEFAAKREKRMFLEKGNKDSKTTKASPLRSP